MEVDVKWGPKRCPRHRRNQASAALPFASSSTLPHCYLDDKTVYTTYFCLFCNSCSCCTFLVSTHTCQQHHAASEWGFEAHRGYFSHDQDSASWELRATTLPSLGLLERDYPTDDTFQSGESHARRNVSHTQWSRFLHFIRCLNEQDSTSRQYKLLYVVRCGQGLHNVKETEVGREEWNVR